MEMLCHNLHYSSGEKAHLQTDHADSHPQNARQETEENLALAEEAMRSQLQTLIDDTMPELLEYQRRGHNLLFPAVVDLNALRSRLETLRITDAVPTLPWLLTQLKNPLYAFLDQFRLFRDQYRKQNLSPVYVKYPFAVEAKGLDVDTHVNGEAIAHANSLSICLSESFNLIETLDNNPDITSWATFQKTTIVGLIEQLVPHDSATASTRARLEKDSPATHKMNAIVNSVTWEERLRYSSLATKLTGGSERLAVKIKLITQYAENVASKNSEVGRFAAYLLDVSSILKQIVEALRIWGTQLNPEQQAHSGTFTLPENEKRSLWKILQKERKTLSKVLQHTAKNYPQNAVENFRELKGEVKGIIGKTQVQTKTLVKDLKHTVKNYPQLIGEGLKDAGIVMHESRTAAVYNTLSARLNKTAQRSIPHIPSSANAVLDEKIRKSHESIFSAGIRLLDKIQQSQVDIHKARQTARPLEDAVTLHNRLSEPIGLAGIDLTLDAKLAEESARWEKIQDAEKLKLLGTLNGINGLAELSNRNDFSTSLSNELSQALEWGMLDALASDFDEGIEILAGVEIELRENTLRLSMLGEKGGQLLDVQIVKWIRKLGMLKDRVKVAITKATGRSINSFSRNGMVAKRLAELSLPEKQHWLAELTGEQRAEAETQYDDTFLAVLNDYLPKISKDTDPQSAVLLARLRLEIGHAAAGTTLYPVTIAEILAGMKSMDVAIQDWSRRKLVRTALLAASLSRFKLLPNLAALPLRIAIKFVITGAKVALASRKGKQGIRSGEGDIGDEIKEFAKRSFSASVVKIMLTLPPGLATALGLATVVMDVYSGGLKDAAGKIAKEVIGESPWLGLDVGSQQAVKAYIESAIKNAQDNVLPEQEDGVSAVKTQSAQAQLKRMEASSDPLTRELAADLATQPDMSNIKMQSSAGWQRSSYDSGADVIRLREGASDREMLHEIAHALTARKIGYGLKNPDSNAGRLTARLEALRQKAADAWTREGGQNEEIMHYFGSVEEFVAGLYSGNTEFLQHLSSINVEGDNLLTRMTKIICELLGLDESRVSALTEAISLSDSLMATKVAEAREIQASGVWYYGGGGMGNTSLNAPGARNGASNAVAPQIQPNEDLYRDRSGVREFNIPSPTSSWSPISSVSNADFNFPNDAKIKYHFSYINRSGHIVNRVGYITIPREHRNNRDWHKYFSAQLTKLIDNDDLLKDKFIVRTQTNNRNRITFEQPTASHYNDVYFTKNKSRGQSASFTWKVEKLSENELLMSRLSDLRAESEISALHDVSDNVSEELLAEDECLFINEALDFLDASPQETVNIGEDTSLDKAMTRALVFFSKYYPGLLGENASLDNLNSHELLEHLKSLYATLSDEKKDDFIFISALFWKMSNDKEFRITIESLMKSKNPLLLNLRELIINDYQDAMDKKTFGVIKLKLSDLKSSSEFENDSEYFKQYSDYVNEDIDNEAKDLSTHVLVGSGLNDFDINRDVKQIVKLTISIPIALTTTGRVSLRVKPAVGDVYLFKTDSGKSYILSSVGNEVFIKFVDDVFNDKELQNLFSGGAVNSELSNKLENFFRSEIPLDDAQSQGEYGSFKQSHTRYATASTNLYRFSTEVQSSKNIQTLLDEVNKDHLSRLVNSMREANFAQSGLANFLDIVIPGHKYYSRSHSDPTYTHSDEDAYGDLMSIFGLIPVVSGGVAGANVARQAATGAVRNARSMGVRSTLAMVRQAASAASPGARKMLSGMAKELASEVFPPSDLIRASRAGAKFVRRRMATSETAGGWGSARIPLGDSRGSGVRGGLGRRLYGKDNPLAAPRTDLAADGTWPGTRGTLTGDDVDATASQAGASNGLESSSGGQSLNGRGTFSESWQVENIEFSALTPDTDGIYQVRTPGGEYDKYIKQGNSYYRVKYDTDNGTWRLVNPEQSFTSGHHRPVRRNAQGDWEFHSNVGLSGGGRHARPSQFKPTGLNDILPQRTKLKTTRDRFEESRPITDAGTSVLVHVVKTMTPGQRLAGAVVIALGLGGFSIAGAMHSSTLDDVADDNLGGQDMQQDSQVKFEPVDARDGLWRMINHLTKLKEKFKQHDPEFLARIRPLEVSYFGEDDHLSAADIEEILEYIKKIKMHADDKELEEFFAGKLPNKFLIGVPDAFKRFEPQKVMEFVGEIIK